MEDIKVDINKTMIQFDKDELQQMIIGLDLLIHMEYSKVYTHGLSDSTLNTYIGMRDRIRERLSNL